MPNGIYLVNDRFRYEGMVSKANVAGLISSRVVQLLRKEREQQGMSMNVLAQRSGLAQSTISRIEHELRIPNLETLLRMSMALEVDLGRVIQQAKAETGPAKRG